jgi:hypothetical protein
MLTVEVEAGQTPLLTDHCRMLFPTPILLTGLKCRVPLETAAVPLTTDQLPVPTDGALPFNVKVVAQMVLLLPALDTVGKSSRVICTVEVDEGQTPLPIDH